MSDNTRNDPEFEDEQQFDEEFDSEFADGDQQYADPGMEEEFSAEDFDEEEWSDDEFGEESDPRLMAKEKKSFLNFNTMVIGAGLVVGLGMFLMQVTGGKEDTAPTEAPVATVPMDGTRDNIVFRGTRDREEEENAEQGTGAGGFLSGALDPNQLPESQPRRNAPVVVDEPPMPAPFTQPGTKAESPQAPPAPAAQPKTDFPDPLTPMPGPSAEPAGLPSLSPPEKTAAAQPRATQPAPKAQPESSNRLMDLQSPRETGPAEAPSPMAMPAAATASPELIDQLEDIAARLETLEERVSEASQQAAKAMETRSAAAGSTDGASSAEVESLKKTIARLEGKVARLESAPAPKAAASSSATAPAPRAEAPRPRPAATRAAPPAPKWELRAAQPGRAWIAASGSDEMRMVDIGDTVEGLGQISSIAYQNGRWVIRGSQNSITQ